MGKLFASLILLLTIVDVLCASDFFVSAANGRNSNPGTAAAPLKNIWKAIEKAVPGDVIHIAEGSYYGKFSCGWIKLDKPLALIGGYSGDFSQRNPQKFHTFLRPLNRQNQTKPVMATLTVDVKKYGSNAVTTIDGLIFDHTLANSYHASEGKFPGASGGIFVVSPAKGNSEMSSIDRALLHASSDGILNIYNCIFLNASNFALKVSHFYGQVNVVNNIFAGSRMAAVDVRSANAQNNSVKHEFAGNTVLFSWCRTKAMEDMGFAVRCNEKVISSIHHNIIALSGGAGCDNTLGDPAKKQIVLTDNVFFLNKKGDVAVTLNSSVKQLSVREDEFEDLADMPGFVNVYGNKIVSDPALFKNIINMDYLEAFVKYSYSEKIKYDSSSWANQLRAMCNLNQQGTVKTKVTMYGNSYPFEDVLKLFGAVKNYGVQKYE